jgi:hypothetical protein
MPFDAKTLLVTGAGASAELDFPVGDKLKESIRALTNVDWNGLELRGDRHFCRVLEDFARANNGGNLGPVISSCKHIHENVILSGSIDQFLSSHQNDLALVQCAKLAIAFEIGKAESASHLNIENNAHAHTDFIYLKDSYLPRMWARLQNGLPIAEWKSYFNNLKIITFNYDRTLEQFIRLALTRFCKADDYHVLEFIGQLPILHVYGNLGSLGKSEDHCPYAPNHHQVIGAASRILTFSETVNDNIREEISDYFKWADRIVFLGFSYANVNVELFPRIENSAKRVFGTSRGMSAANTEHARLKLNWLVDAANARATLSPTNCAKLFDDFELQLC